MSVPTRVFFRDLAARSPNEVQAAYTVLHAHLRQADMSPQQRAWLIGARAMAAWVLGMPKTGHPVAVMLDGIATPGVVSLAPADDWAQARRDVLAGIGSYDGFNTGSG